MSAFGARLLTALAAIALSAMLGACASVPAHPIAACESNSPPPPPPPAPVPPPVQSGVAGRLDALMQYYDFLRKQPPAALVQEYKNAVQEFAQTESDSSRVRMAILLVLPNTSFHDVPAALHLLDNWPEDPKIAPSALDGFARLFSVMLTQQQQQTSAISDLAQKLKDAKKRGDTLQDKIDAIKTMEKNLIDRTRQ